VAQIREGMTHGEAFCLMMYVDEKTGEREWLWNSRDGVTPFIIGSPAGNPSRHDRWGEDVFVPNFVPPLGMRVFVDMTPERRLELMRRRVEEMWDHPECPMKDHPELGAGTKEDAAKMLAESDGWTEGEPDILVVDEELRAEFVARKLMDPPRLVPTVPRKFG